MATTSPQTQHASVAHFELPLADQYVPSQPDSDEFAAQRDRSLLLQNATWFCRLRWIVAGVLTTVGIVAYCPTWTAQIGVALTPWPIAIAATLAIANAVYLFILKRLSSDPTAGRLRVLLWCQIVVDLVILTVVIHHLGSRVTYAPVAYLFHIILACIFFHRSESLGVTVVSAALYVCLVGLEHCGVLDPSSPFAATEAVALSYDGSTWIWQLGSLLSIWLIIWYLASRLAAELRDRECELAATNRRLEASSAERARHMLQTTHQLKAPFAAIHANTQLLLGGYTGSLPEQSRTVVEKIASRSRLLSRQIQQMLQLANLRSQSQSTPKRELVDLQTLIQGAVERIEPIAATRHIDIDADLESLCVHSIDDYLKMLIDNLLDNAVSYSFDGGHVGVVCRREDQTTATISIRDHGIGISAEKLPHVFKDYYRTTEATRHNKASTGLGLAIVRLVSKALQISVRVESLPGWGTRFTLQIPLTADASTLSTLS